MKNDTVLGADQPTPWYQDDGQWPTLGQQMCCIFPPLRGATAPSALETECAV